MTHARAKQLLAEQAGGTIEQRQQAVEAALALGMPLHAIEEYLDWLDAARPPTAPEAPPRPDAKEASPQPDIPAPNIPAPNIAARKRPRSAPAP